MPAVHGLVAGWRFGAFAIVIYILPAPPSTWRCGFGYPEPASVLGPRSSKPRPNGLFGLIARRRGLSDTAIRLRALRTAGKALTWGGMAFMVGGRFGLAFSSLTGFSMTTGVHVHNLDHLGVALVLVVVSVVGVGASSLVRLAAPGQCGELVNPICFYRDGLSWSDRRASSIAPRHGVHAQWREARGSGFAVVQVGGPPT